MEAARRYGYGVLVGEGTAGGRRGRRDPDGPDASTLALDLSRHIDDCRRMSTMDNGVGVDNEEQGSVVALCRVPSTGWAALWPTLQHYD